MTSESLIDPTCAMLVVFILLDDTDTSELLSCAIAVAKTNVKTLKKIFFMF